MYCPLVRVLTRCLIREQWQKKVLAEGGVRVQEDRPSREDYINGADILFAMIVRGIVEAIPADRRLHRRWISLSRTS